MWTYNKYKANQSNQADDTANEEQPVQEEETQAPLEEQEPPSRGGDVEMTEMERIDEPEEVNYQHFGEDTIDENPSNLNLEDLSSIALSMKDALDDGRALVRCQDQLIRQLYRQGKVRSLTTLYP